MKKRYYIFSGAIILALIVFVFVDEINGNYYNKSVEETHGLLINSDINISYGELETSGPELLKINVVREGEKSELKNYITIPIDNLLDRKFINRLRKHEGTIVIVSDDIGLSANAWLMLNRKGIHHIKVLDIEDNETFKYTFEPEIK